MKDFENSSSSTGEKDNSNMLYSRSSGSGSHTKWATENDENSPIINTITL